MGGREKGEKERGRDMRKGEGYEKGRERKIEMGREVEKERRGREVQKEREGREKEREVKKERRAGTRPWSRC